MLKNWKRIKKSLFATFTLLAAIVIMAFSSTVYAATQVKVTFNANGGTCKETSKTVTYKKAYGTLPTPTKTGYEFVNWYSEKEGGYVIVSATPVEKNYNHQIYARWKAKTYTVYFKPEGGTVSPTYKKVVYDQPYGTLPSPSKTGYIFAGWYDSKGNRIYSTTPVRTAGSHDLYARWNPKTITITLDANGGSVSPTKITAKYDEKITLPTAKRTGYTFAGWSTSKNGNPNYFATGSKLNKAVDFTLYARWYKKVAFETNGGASVAARNYLMGKTYGSLPVTSKSGNRFLGWYRGQNSGVKVLASDEVLSLNTLYAKWEQITGKFVKQTCHIYDREGKLKATYLPEDHVRAFTENDRVVQGLRNVVRKQADSKQKYAALYALDAVGSYYCQEQRNTEGAYDCSSLVSRSYTFAGVTSTFGDLPVTGTMKPRLDELVRQGKAVRVTNKQYQMGDIMFNNSDYTHVSIYIGEYNGVKYRVSAEGHKYGVGYFDVTKRDYTYVYRLK